MGTNVLSIAEQHEMETKIQSRVVINVRNTRYETQPSTLSRFPETLLGSVIRRAQFYDKRRNEIVFNADIQAFDAILFYYQSDGILSKPCWISMDKFESECRYFGIDEDRITKMKIREGYVKTQREISEVSSNSFREQAWIFLEYPETSTYATLYSVINLLFVIASNIILFAMTLTDLHSKENRTSISRIFQTHLPLSEFVLQLCFAIDFVARMMFAKQKSKLFRSVIFWIDFFAIFPYFMMIFLRSKNNTLSKFHGLEVFNTLRILRVFRWSKYYKTLYIVMNILNRCSEGFVMFSHSILAICMLFASLGYYAELGSESTQLNSLPQSMWWAIQTMVCLGYGDVVPTTITGKVAGSCVAIIGAITLTVPLISIGGKYMYMYTNTFSLSMGRDMTLTSGVDKEVIKKKRNFIIT